MKSDKNWTNEKILKNKEKGRKKYHEKKVKNDCSNISKFSPKFVLCKAGKGAGKVKGALKLSKIKEAYENRPTKGKKTLVDVFKKDKKDN